MYRPLKVSLEIGWLWLWAGLFMVAGYVVVRGLIEVLAIIDRIMETLGGL